MNGPLKILVAVACVAVIAFVGYFFVDRINSNTAHNAALQASIRQAQIDATCSPEERKAAKALLSYGPSVFPNGWMTKEDAQRCSP